MSDADAISGEGAGYVPCGGASATIGLADDAVAVFGEGEGYVSITAAAGSAPASFDDTAAVYGSAVGYVAAPCDCVFDDMNRTDTSAWGVTSSASGTWAGLKIGDASPTSGIIFADSIVPTHGIMKITHPTGTWQGIAEERIVGPGFWSSGGDWLLTTSVSVINSNVVAWALDLGTAGVGWSRNDGGPGVARLRVTNNGTSTAFPLSALVFDGTGFVDVLIRKNGSTITAKVAGLQLSHSNFDPPGVLDDLVITLSGLAAVINGAEIHWGVMVAQPTC